MASRFGVAPVAERTADGIVFASKKEMHRYHELNLLLRAGLIADLECQPAFKVAFGAKPYCTYTADFCYYDNRTKRIVIEDVKSTGTAKDAAYRLRKKAAELFHGIKVVEVLR